MKQKTTKKLALHILDKKGFQQRSVLVHIRKAVLLLLIIYVISVLFLLCFYARLFIDALWSPTGKGLNSWLSFVMSILKLSFSHWYPGSGVVLYCFDSRSLPSF